MSSTEEPTEPEATKAREIEATKARIAQIKVEIQEARDHLKVAADFEERAEWRVVGDRLTQGRAGRPPRVG
jgi:hypothetical protein